MTTSFDDEAKTRSSVPRLLAREVPPLSDDLHEAMGQLMSETVRQGRRVDALSEQLSSALEQFKSERGDLVKGASKTAAGHTSNRMAALLGALFILYSEAAPVLHELWRMIRK